MPSLIWDESLQSGLPACVGGSEIRMTRITATLESPGLPTWRESSSGASRNSVGQTLSWSTQPDRPEVIKSRSRRTTNGRVPCLNDSSMTRTPVQQVQLAAAGNTRPSNFLHRLSNCTMQVLHQEGCAPPTRAMSTHDTCLTRYWSDVRQTGSTTVRPPFVSPLQDRRLRILVEKPDSD